MTCLLGTGKSSIYFGLGFLFSCGLNWFLSTGNHCIGTVCCSYPEESHLVCISLDSLSGCAVRMTWLLHWLLFPSARWALSRWCTCSLPLELLHHQHRHSPSMMLWKGMVFRKRQVRQSDSLVSRNSHILMMCGQTYDIVRHNCNSSAKILKDVGCQGFESSCSICDAFSSFFGVSTAFSIQIFNLKSLLQFNTEPLMHLLTREDN